MKIDTETIDSTRVGLSPRINFDHPDVIEGVKKIMNKRKIVEYYLFRRESAPEITKLVNEYINKGWQPFGAPFSDADSDDAYLCQAMVKYEQ